MRLSIGLFVAAMVFTPSVSAAPADCARSARDLEARLTLVNGSADQDGAYRMIYLAARKGVEECPDSEPLGYLAARLAELGYDQDPRVQVPSEEAKRLAKRLSERHRASARLATVEARFAGDVESARRAVALDKSYGPARLALAMALLSTGKASEALPLTSRETKAPVSERVVRARILMALGRFAEAASAVQQRRTSASAEPEVWAPNLLERDEEEVLGLALSKAGRPREAKAHLQKAAAYGSAPASAALKGIAK